MKEPAAFPRWLALFFLPLAGACAPAALNGIRSPNGGLVSRALVLLPKDRAQAGVISFEIERGPHAGLHRCEALGRGRTSMTPVAGWIRSAIGKTTIYYAPMDAPDGATPVGIYDARNISTSTYEIAFLDKASDGASAAPKPYFSAVRTYWYPKSRLVLPIDLIWAEDYQRYSQGAAFPVREGRPGAFAARQLAHNPRYYRGPFGRSGLAVHTDLWDEPERRADPAFAGRPELDDFRRRDTDGCLKVRPACLALLNEWVDEQARLGRRVQLEVRQ